MHLLALRDWLSEIIHSVMANPRHVTIEAIRYVAFVHAPICMVGDWRQERILLYDLFKANHSLIIQYIGELSCARHAGLSLVWLRGWLLC